MRDGRRRMWLNMPRRFSSPRKRSRWARGDFNICHSGHAQLEPEISNFGFAPCDRPGMTRKQQEAHMTKLTHKAAGTFAIAPTPFHDDGRIDEKSIDRLTDFYAEVGLRWRHRARHHGRGAEARWLGSRGGGKALCEARQEHADHRRRLRAGICRHALAGARLDGCRRRRGDDRAAAQPAHRRPDRRLFQAGGGGDRRATFPGCCRTIR